MYKLLVVDIDGTLLGKDRTISEEDKQALAGAVRAGIGVSLSTGRVVQAARSVLARLELDGYHIFFDGGLVYNPSTKEEVYADPIEPQKLREFIEYAQGIGLDVDLYSIDNFYAEKESWATDIRRDFFNTPVTIDKFSRLWREERILKGTMVVKTPEGRARAEQVRQAFNGRLNFSWSHTPAYPGVDFINVIAPDVSKGTSLHWLVNFLGVSLDEVVAIGDGLNDIPLLESAGLSIAVGNAPDEVKELADHVTLDVDHSGVAAAVKQFLL